MRHLHQSSVRYLSEGLARLGVLPGKSAGEYVSQHYRRFYPHSVGHWLGLDTHDSSAMPHDRPLEPGGGAWGLLSGRARPGWAGGPAWVLVQLCAVLPGPSGQA